MAVYMTINGYVKDSVTLEPIIGASIQDRDIAPTVGVGGLTSADGSFIASFPTKPQMLVVTALGYEDKYVSYTTFTNGSTIYLTPTGSDLGDEIDPDKPLIPDLQFYTYRGTVTDRDTGFPIANARVSTSNSMERTTTDDFGNYTLLTSTANPRITVTAEGYMRFTKTATSTVLDFALSRGSISQSYIGYVYDSEGNAIVGANVVLVNNHSIGAITDISGKYTISINKLGIGHYLVAYAVGYKPQIMAAGSADFYLEDDVTGGYNIVGYIYTNLISGESGVKITRDNGSYTTTNAGGVFLLSGIPTSEWNSGSLKIEKQGYETIYDNIQAMVSNVGSYMGFVNVQLTESTSVPDIYENYKTINVWKNHKCDSVTFNNSSSIVNPFANNQTDWYLQIGDNSANNYKYIYFDLIDDGIVTICLECKNAVIEYDRNIQSHVVDNTFIPNGHLNIEIYDKTNQIVETKSIEPRCYSTASQDSTKTIYTTASFKLNNGQYHFAIDNGGLFYGPFNYKGSGSENATLATYWDLTYSVWQTPHPKALVTVTDCRHLIESSFKDTTASSELLQGDYIYSTPTKRINETVTYTNSYGDFSPFKTSKGVLVATLPSVPACDRLDVELTFYCEYVSSSTAMYYNNGSADMMRFGITKSSTAPSDETYCSSYTAHQPSYPEYSQDPSNYTSVETLTLDNVTGGTYYVYAWLDTYVVNGAADRYGNYITSNSVNSNFNIWAEATNYNYNITEEKKYIPNKTITYKELMDEGSFNIKSNATYVAKQCVKFEDLLYKE